MKAQERLLFLACAIEFMTKILAASGLAISFELQNCDNECGFKTRIDFCCDSMAV